MADLFVYRPILIWAQLKGLVDFLRGDKRWHKFARNRRTAAAALGAPEPAAAVGS